jgi:hypothetical protein
MWGAECHISILECEYVAGSFSSLRGGFLAQGDVSMRDAAPPLVQKEAGLPEDRKGTT